jgi:hypothetical protein
MDPNAVFLGLKNNADAITGLQCFDFAPDSVPVPCFFPMDLHIDFDKAFAGGMDDWIVTCRLLVSLADDRAGQKALKQYLTRTGATSIKQAIEAEKTLGGACDAVHVMRATGYGRYEHADTHYYGAEFAVRVIGPGD